MSRQPAPSARSGRSPLIYLLALVVIAALIAGGYGLWYLFLRPAGPAAVADATLPPVPGVSGASTVPLTSVDGTWNVDTSIGTFTGVDDTSGNFVGYRVQEQLAGIGANVAVGRDAQGQRVADDRGDEGHGRRHHRRHDRPPER